jgi:hypothetical protein
MIPKMKGGKMKLISHRGNLNGPNPKLENSPEYVLRALNQGFDVEIDVWFSNGEYFLGHDNPQFAIDEKFLQDDRLWCHAKNLQALDQMLANGNIHCFWHQTDQVTLTSQNVVWTFPGEKQIRGSICVLPETSTEINENIIGICSDFIKEFKC